MLQQPHLQNNLYMTTRRLTETEGSSIELHQVTSSELEKDQMTFLNDCQPTHFSPGM
uniref:Uncharacterized protein n=1 Tax=Arundo donax TaxID=35708 RepID=A0A0A9HJL6_ARUDO